MFSWQISFPFQSILFSDLFRRQTVPAKNRFVLPCGMVSESEKDFLQVSTQQNDMPAADGWLRQSACRNEQSRMEYRLLPLEPTAGVNPAISIPSHGGLIAAPLKYFSIVPTIFNAFGCAPAFACQSLSIDLTRPCRCLCGRSTFKIKNGLSAYITAASPRGV